MKDNKRNNLIKWISMLLLLTMGQMLARYLYMGSEYFWNHPSAMLGDLFWAVIINCLGDYEVKMLKQKNK
jgi:hypothetical protein